ncbi:hypothetical protein BIY23_04480 [Wolbachia pipientis]|uniref:Tetratricopeptide repeat protein n=1 Tax=Wolbachia pipientis TaxID=955 RepID=A0A1E7QIT0_WOLPI|nr:hypothetical protein [Wolbachia pipientis]OEY86378.1 hypothetical protein BIY23_04480 [Wolbachia pipientis]
MHDEYHDTLVRYYHYQDFLLLCWHYQNEGKWSEIIAYGESSLEFIKGLDSSKFSKKDYEYRVNISCEIISCHFYLGDHDKALKVAKDATAYTKQISNNDLKVRISYLISACYRALASKEKGEQHEKYKKDADDYIKEACALCNKYPISQGIKIKVYFNAGALEQDLNNSPSAARKYYEQALNILENPEFKDKFFDNYCRTQIRYIRALLEDTSSDISFHSTKLRFPCKCANDNIFPRIKSK